MSYKLYEVIVVVSGQIIYKDMNFEEDLFFLYANEFIMTHS